MLYILLLILLWFITRESSGSRPVGGGTGDPARSVIKDVETGGPLRRRRRRSKKINVKKGTEQGHPLSPDLFKIFLADLSPLLDFKNCPSLANKIISHLLWADDLILLSLDPQTTQAQLDVLDKFCKTWGIEINELKTKTVIFNKKYINDNPEPTFKINGKTLQNVDSYTAT